MSKKKVRVLVIVARDLSHVLVGLRKITAAKIAQTTVNRKFQESYPNSFFWSRGVAVEYLVPASLASKIEGVFNNKFVLILKVLSINFSEKPSIYPSTETKDDLSLKTF